MDELFETEEPKPKTAKQVWRLHRKLFLLVFATALLAQGWLLGHKGLSEYHRALLNDFKVLLTVDSPVDDAQLAQWQETLSQQPQIRSVRLFSPQEALQTVRQQNPQLAENLLRIGKNQMPAYFEITLSPVAISNIGPLTGQWRTVYPSLSARYHSMQARQICYTGALLACMRVLGGIILLALLAFMFLIEAAPYAGSGTLSGAVSGVLAGVLAVLCVGGVLYPWGLFYEVVTQLVAWGQQILLVVFSGLLGWTLAKWQRF